MEKELLLKEKQLLEDIIKIEERSRELCDQKIEVSLKRLQQVHKLLDLNINKD